MSWSKELESKFFNFTKESNSKGNQPITLDLLYWSGILQESESLLSIGGGRGGAELVLMKEFAKRVGYIDPSASLKDSFCIDVDNQNTKDLLVEAIETKFEDYNSSYKYDAAIAVHSLYYIDINNSFFRKLENILKPNGKILSVLTTQDDFSKRLMSKFTPDRKLLNHENLVNKFTEYSLLTKIKTVDIPVDFNNYLEGSSLSSRGIEWTSYMLNIDKSLIEGKLKSEVEEFFLSERESNACFKVGALLSELKKIE